MVLMFYNSLGPLSSYTHTHTHAMEAANKNSAVPSTARVTQWQKESGQRAKAEARH